MTSHGRKLTARRAGFVALTKAQYPLGYSRSDAEQELAYEVGVLESLKRAAHRTEREIRELKVALANGGRYA